MITKALALVRSDGTAVESSGLARSSQAPVRLLLALALTLTALLALAAAPAQAALSFPFDGQLAPSSGSFGQLDVNSVAVNDFNSHTYVADSGSSVVNVFDSGGTQLASLDGSLTPAGSFGGGKVLVAANNASGEVYVLDQTDNLIDAFDSSGNYVCQITGAAVPSASECNGPAGSATPAGGFSTPFGLAVNQSTGDLYVLDASNGAVDLFSAAGAYLSGVDLSTVPGGIPDPSQVRGIAVSGFNGHLYVADSSFARQVYEFDASGTYVTTWTGSNTPAGSFVGNNVSVAVDDATGDVFVTSGQSGFNDPSQIVTDVFDASGTYLGQFSHSYSWPYGTAVGQASGKVYVSDNAFGKTAPAFVDIFGPGVVVPDVTTGAASNIQPTSATLGGTVNPAGVAVSDCHFSYVDDADYNASLSNPYAAGQTAPCGETVGSGSSDVPVHADLTGLSGGVTYHFRLEASNANGSNAGSDATFQTPPPPSIDAAFASNLTPTDADLNAQINPNGFQLTDCHFEWGTDTSYGTSVPCSPDAASIPPDSVDHAVTTHLTGLTQNTTYHWRIIATNANGTVGASVDHTFVYDTTGQGLPDARAYEQVTPAHKNGALIGATAFGLLPEASQSGSRLVATTLQCFADAGSCTVDRQEVGTPYFFDRTAAGWQPTALAPPASQLPVNAPFSANVDSGTALFGAPTPPTGQDDWYARHSDGTFTDLGPSTPPAEGPQPFIVGTTARAATPDLSHLVWGHVDTGWPFAADPQTLYQYSGPCGSPSACQAAQPLLVGVGGPNDGPGSTDLISTCRTDLGAPFGSHQGDLSADGRTVFFTARRDVTGPCPGGSGANALTPVPADALYARIDGELPTAHTVPISERSPAGCSGSCLTSPPGDAAFWGASDDASKVFFASTQQLTDDASQDDTAGDSARGSGGCQNTTGPNGCNLYLYDFTKPAGHELIDVSAGDTSSHGPRVQGPMALSPDGSHLYFVAQGVLTATPNAQGQSAADGSDNLYLYDANSGDTSFIATLPHSDQGNWGAGGGSQLGNVTPDGRFLVFPSHGPLTPDATSASGATQVFRYDAQSGELIRISIGESGFNDNGNRSAPTPCQGQCSEDARIARPYTSSGRTDPTLSHDGSYVFFQSPVALTPGALDDVQVADLNGLPQYAQNVYEWHAGHVSLISDGRDATKGFDDACLTENSSVCLIGASGSGHDVFFSTVDPLVPQDTDTELDFYDARVGGGFPYTPPPEPCQGDNCKPPPSGTPPGDPRGSATATGPGNQAPVHGSATSKKKCKRSTRRVKHHKRKCKKSRRANSNRGGSK